MSNKIELTLGELNSIVDSLNSIVKTPMPASYAFRFGKMAKALGEDLAVFLTQRDSLIRKYGKIEGEMVKVTPENHQAYAKDISELMAHKIFVDFDPIPISVLGDSKVRSFDMAWLEKFFYDDSIKQSS